MLSGLLKLENSVKMSKMEITCRSQEIMNFSNSFWTCRCLGLCGFLSLFNDPKSFFFFYCLFVLFLHNNVLVLLVHEWMIASCSILDWFLAEKNLPSVSLSGRAYLQPVRIFHFAWQSRDSECVACTWQKCVSVLMHTVNTIQQQCILWQTRLWLVWSHGVKWFDFTNSTHKKPW